jgi:hypothetical protein
MPTYVVRNRVEIFKRHPREFEALDDIKAIREFRMRYTMYTDDGGWNLTRADDPSKVLASTEDGWADKPVVSYLNYATWPEN